MTGSLTDLVLAALAFGVSHVWLAAPSVRGALAGRLGEYGYLALYSLVALGLFAWMIAAYLAVPEVVVWRPPIGLRHLGLAVMLAAAVLVAAGYATPNPTMAVLGRVDRPPEGIVKVTRHPILWGFGLWAVAHGLAVGDAAGMVLFATVGALAFGGTVRIDRRKRLAGDEAWRALEAGTSNVPFVAIAQGRARVTLAEIGWWRLGLGVLLFGLLFLGHEWAIGVQPFRT